MQQVIPVPESVREAPGVRFELGPDSAIGADPAAAGVAEYLAGVLRPATGYALPTGERGDLVLRLDDAGFFRPALGGQPGCGGGGQWGGQWDP